MQYHMHSLQAPEGGHPAARSRQQSAGLSETFSDSIDWVHLARLVAHFDSLDVAWTGEVPFEEFIARCVQAWSFCMPASDKQAASKCRVTLAHRLSKEAGVRSSFCLQLVLL